MLNAAKDAGFIFGDIYDFVSVAENNLFLLTSSVDIKVNI